MYKFEVCSEENIVKDDTYGRRSTVNIAVILDENNKCWQMSSSHWICVLMEGDIYACKEFPNGVSKIMKTHIWEKWVRLMLS